MAPGRSKRRPAEASPGARTRQVSTRPGAVDASRGLDLSPGELSVLLREAVDSLVKVFGRDAGASGLPKAEAEVLERGGFDLSRRDLGKSDPLARTTAEFAALLETALTTKDAAKRLDVDPSRIRQRLTESPATVFGVRAGGSWRLPLFQFDGKKLLPGLDRVVRELRPNLHPVAVQRFFMAPHPDLEDDAGRPLSPRDWLRSGGEPAAVAEIAELL